MHLALALGSTHSALCTRHCALGSTHLPLYALGSMRLAPCAWLYALGSTHSALCAWLYALGSMHTWLYAIGSMRLPLCTWLYVRLYALGSMHLCTWLYAIDSAQVTLRKLVRELGSEEPFAMLLGKREREIERERERERHSQPSCQDNGTQAKGRAHTRHGRCFNVLSHTPGTCLSTYGGSRWPEIRKSAASNTLAVSGPGLCRRLHSCNF